MSLYRMDTLMRRARKEQIATGSMVMHTLTACQKSRTLPENAA